MEGDIVAQRDKARKDFFDSIDLFCQEVDLIPLQERENSLQVGNSVKPYQAVYFQFVSNCCNPRFQL